MTLEQLGNLGEFAGLIGVIVTLAILIFQVRANTRTQTQAVAEASYHSYSDIIADVNRVPGVAMAIHKVFTHQPLDSMDRHHLTTYVERVLTAADRSLTLEKMGDFSVTPSSAVGTLDAFLEVDEVQKIYISLVRKRNLFSQELRDYVDNLITAH